MKKTALTYLIAAIPLLSYAGDNLNSLWNNIQASNFKPENEIFANSQTVYGVEFPDGHRATLHTFGSKLRTIRNGNVFYIVKPDGSYVRFIGDKRLESKNLSETEKQQDESNMESIAKEINSRI
ncbi:MAG: hypothetical protein JW716_01935 [Candidatus Aenigmarchaeota archaeon]|nr:hypothetical protein [Candidatus Aenigmarchaeota archaeon]